MAVKPKRLAWAPRADQDLLDIWSYYASEASDEIADKVIGQIVTAARRVGELPLSGRSREDLQAGVRSVLAHPYVVFYRAAVNDVQIVRVLHERRNLGRTGQARIAR
jgi:toxin ParE1/3/4